MKKDYIKKLSKYDTVIARELLTAHFEKQLKTRLALTKIGAPLFISNDKGIQDQLSGKETAVSFVADNTTFEVIHSLAKWKRIALKDYGFIKFSGIVTDMKAIRKDEVTDELHSYLVDQWDWEKIITKDTRTIETLKDTVTNIYKAIKQTNTYIKRLYPKLSLKLPRNVFFITSQELEDKYKDKSLKEREYLITKEYGAVFIIGIGDKLEAGLPHDHRSPDYDDWTMNGDLLIFDEIIDKPMEMSSMGIRVDKDALLSQLKKSDCLDRINNEYHQAIIKDELPLTIGGGIGQSRLCMLLLEKKHIAEVQATYWNKFEIKRCQKDDIDML